jgi:hypothetical protein
VDTDGVVKMCTLGTGLSITAGGEIQGAFLPLSGGIVTGNTEFQGTFKLSGIPLNDPGVTNIMWYNATTKAVSYGAISLGTVVSWGNTTPGSIFVGDIFVTNQMAPASNVSLLYVSDSGKIQKLALGSNLTLDLISTVWTLNASGGTGVTIVGTPNRIAKFNGAGNNVIDSQIYDDGTSVGIFTSPIVGASLRAVKANTTTLAELSNTATTGDVLRAILPTGGGATQNFLRGYQSVTERFRIDIAGKAWFQNLNIALGAASTLPLQITTAGNVIAAQVDYTTQVSGKPSFATVATSGLYSDLIGEPSYVNTQSWTPTFDGSVLTISSNSSYRAITGGVMVIHLSFTVNNSSPSDTGLSPIRTSYSGQGFVKFYGTVKTTVGATSTVYHLEQMSNFLYIVKDDGVRFLNNDYVDGMVVEGSIIIALNA